MATSVLEPVETMGHPPLDPRRLRAHGRARRHSALVRALRVMIPVGSAAAGLAIVIGTYFNPFADLGVSVSLGSIGVSGSKVTMESPRLAGYRGKDNRPYEVTARAALQDVRRPFVIELQSMKGRIHTDEAGGLAHLEAASGVFDTQKESLDLAQSIRLWTDKGQEARLSSAQVNFKAGTLTSREAVAVTLPDGTIRADGLDVTDNGKTISFVGNVRAVFGGDTAMPLRTSSAEVREDKP